MKAGTKNKDIIMRVQDIWEDNHQSIMPQLPKSLEEEGATALRDLHDLVKVVYVVHRRSFNIIVRDSAICQLHGID